jgi:hypothetical protein
MKKLLAVILTLLLSMPLAADAESVQTGKFRYMPAFEEEAAEEDYFYSDEYFKESSRTYNEHLAAMSYNLAVSTFEVRNSSFTEALLGDIGFEEIEVFDIEEKPALDTVGTVIARREVDGKNLIAAAIRGEKYDSEWGNSFIVGKSGNARGFDDAADKVIKRLRDYIAGKGLDNVQIWMTGFSRAGTIADLAGVYINRHPDEFNTGADDLFVYTFEAPAASADDTVYDNIYSVRDKNDLIPLVYPEEWGFHNNGREIIIDSDESVTTFVGLEEKTEYKDVSINEFNDQFISWLASRLSRETYSEYLEEPVSRLLDIYFGKSEEDRKKLNDFVMQDLKEHILDNEENFNILKDKVWSVLGHNSDYLYQSLTDSLIGMIDEVRDTPGGSVLTDEEYQAFTGALYPILRVLGPVIVDDSNYYDGIDYDEFYRNEVENYYLSDEDMGRRDGEESGRSYGYDDGFYGSPRNENELNLWDDYGPAYEEAYRNAYIPAYLEAYDLGTKHSEDLAEKGKYDGARYSYNEGYYAATHGQEPVPYDEYFHAEDWMTDEYIEAYNASYEEEYIRGYGEGQGKPAEDEEAGYPENMMSLYHLRSLMENGKTILQHHYPQHILELIHESDSYYTEGIPEQEDDNKDPGENAENPEGEEGKEDPQQGASGNTGEDSGQNTKEDTKENTKEDTKQDTKKDSGSSRSAKDSSKKTATAKTGDESHPVLWALALSAAFSGLVYMKKRNRKDVRNGRKQ